MGDGQNRKERPWRVVTTPHFISLTPGGDRENHVSAHRWSGVVWRLTCWNAADGSRFRWRATSSPAFRRCNRRLFPSSAPSSTTTALWWLPVSFFFLLIQYLCPQTASTFSVKIHSISISWLSWLFFYLWNSWLCDWLTGCDAERHVDGGFRRHCVGNGRGAGPGAADRHPGTDRHRHGVQRRRSHRRLAGNPNTTIELEKPNRNPIGLHCAGDAGAGRVQRRRLVLRFHGHHGVVRPQLRGLVQRRPDASGQPVLRWERKPPLRCTWLHSYRFTDPSRSHGGVRAGLPDAVAVVHPQTDLGLRHHLVGGLHGRVPRGRNPSAHLRTGLYVGLFLGHFSTAFYVSNSDR